MTSHALALPVGAVGGMRGVHINAVRCFIGRARAFLAATGAEDTLLTVSESTEDPKGNSCVASDWLTIPARLLCVIPSSPPIDAVLAGWSTSRWPESAGPCSPQFDQGRVAVQWAVIATDSRSRFVLRTRWLREVNPHATTGRLLCVAAWDEQHSKRAVMISTGNGGGNITAPADDPGFANVGIVAAAAPCIWGMVGC